MRNTKEIYTQMGSTLIPLTTAKPDDEGNLIFFRQNRKAPMSIKTYSLFCFFIRISRNSAGIIERSQYIATVLIAGKS